jgi:hypothetical protein
MYVLAYSRSFVIFSVAQNTYVSTLFIHPRNSQPEGAHRPETHTRMWLLLFALIPEHHPQSWLVVHQSSSRTFPWLDFLSASARNTALFTQPANFDLEIISSWRFKDFTRFHCHRFNAWLDAKTDQIIDND